MNSRRSRKKSEKFPKTKGNVERTLTNHPRILNKKKILKMTTKVKQLEEDHLMTMVLTAQMMRMKDKEEEDHLEGHHLHPGIELTTNLSVLDLFPRFTATSGHQGPRTTMEGPTLMTGYSSWNSTSILLEPAHTIGYSMHASC